MGSVSMGDRTRIVQAKAASKVRWEANDHEGSSTHPARQLTTK